MNVNKLISKISGTRKLLQVVAYHPAAVPSIQLSDEKYESAKPFLKQLFRALDHKSFEIWVSKWGEIYAFSPEKRLAISIHVTEETLGEQLEINEFCGGESGYKTFVVSDTAPPLVLRYSFPDSRSKWRSIVIGLYTSELEGTIEQALAEITRLGIQFEGRTTEMPDLFMPSLSVGDLHALALYASRHVASVRAWRGIQRVCSQSYVENFKFFDGGINIETRLPCNLHTFCWHQADITFNKRYLRGIELIFQ